MYGVSTRELKPGIECVLDTIGFDAMLEDAELVITGEGRIDSQSVHGKVISGIAKRTRLRGIPLIALVGGIAEGAEAGYDLGVTAMFGHRPLCTGFSCVCFGQRKILSANAGGYSAFDRGGERLTSCCKTDSTANPQCGNYHRSASYSSVGMSGRGMPMRNGRWVPIFSYSGA